MESATITVPFWSVAGISSYFPLVPGKTVAEFTEPGRAYARSIQRRLAILAPMIHTPIYEQKASYGAQE